MQGVSKCILYILLPSTCKCIENNNKIDFVMQFKFFCTHLICTVKFWDIMI